MEKISGDDTMMCGCEAPAGGTFEKAWAAGGCGHEFNFRTLAPLEKPGEPHNARQSAFDDDVNGKMYCVENAHFSFQKLAITLSHIAARASETHEYTNENTEQ